MEILIIFFLILLNGVFSMSEIALVSSRKFKLETAAKKGNKNAKLALGGALVGAVIVIATRSIIDIPTALIALASLLSLIYINKIQEPYVIAVAAVLGILLKML